MIKQFHTVAVGSVHIDSYGKAMSFSQQAAFGPFLASVCRIRPSTLTPQGEPWSWLHPLPATPTQAPIVHRIPPGQLATPSRRPPLCATPGSGHVPCLRLRSNVVRPSTDIPYVGYRICHPNTGERVLGAVLLWAWVLRTAAVAQSDAITHLECANHRPQALALPFPKPSSLCFGRRLIDFLNFVQGIRIGS